MVEARSYDLSRMRGWKHTESFQTGGTNCMWIEWKKLKMRMVLQVPS